MMAERCEFLVVGAGFAGSVVAQQLHEAGRHVVVVDRRDHIAGNAGEKVVCGVRVHRYGPHLFNANDQGIVDYLSRFTSWEPYTHRVLALTDVGLLPIPVNATTVELTYGLELPTPERVDAFLETKRVKYDHAPRTVEEKVLSEVGPDLYELIFRPYTEKQWGRSCSKLDASVVGRLQPRLDRDDRYFQAKFQAMPRPGYTELFEAMLDGIDVRLGVEFKDVDLEYEHVVWTGPLDEAFDFKYGRLPWRSLVLTEHVESEPLPSAVLTTPGDEYKTTRVTDYAQFTGRPSAGTRVLHAEHASAVGDPYYPVPAPDARDLQSAYEQERWKRPDWTFVGRLARYQYLSMHQVVGQALKAARDLLWVYA